jgi:hypothetical protein
MNLQANPPFCQHFQHEDSPNIWSERNCMYVCMYVWACARVCTVIRPKAGWILIQCRHQMRAHTHTHTCTHIIPACTHDHAQHTPYHHREAY